MRFFNYFKKKNNFKQDTNLSTKNTIDFKFKTSWNYDLIELLKNSREGNSNEINKLIKTYSPLVAVNDNFSVFILFRYFKVQNWNNERSVLNCHPDDDNFKMGITIVQVFEDGGGSKLNVYLPNDLSYKKLKIQNNEIEIITSEDKVVNTNVKELCQKLWMKKTEKDIEDGFKSLCNEQYEKPKKLKVKDKIINLSSCGKLIYNEKLEWYEGKFELENYTIDVYINIAESEELKKLISFVEKNMKLDFFEKMLLKMSEEMVEQKNSSWLGEDELPITIEDFRKRISIESIVFYDDSSSSIYCNDNDLFWGHSIEININKNGEFEDADIVG